MIGFLTHLPLVHHSPFIIRYSGRFTPWHALPSENKGTTHCIRLKCYPFSIFASPPGGTNVAGRSLAKVRSAVWHSPKFADCRSWGPEKDEESWWQVEFGRVVEIDKVVIVLRADFPHDSHWHQVTLVFSDGHRQTIDLEKKAEPQTFTFEARKTSSLRLTDLVQDEPPGWCALAEVEAWGRDLIAVAEDLSTPSP